MNQNPHDKCPGEDVLRDMAAGVASQETILENGPHITECGSCQPMLKKYLSEFSDEIDPRDAAMYATLKTSDPAWQKKFVREQIASAKPTIASGKPVKERSWLTIPPYWRRVIWLAGAPAAILLVALTGGPVMISEFSIWNAKKMVNTAFLKSPGEMLFAGAPPVPFAPTPSQVLGPIILPDNPDLDTASGFVGRHLLTSADPRWLQLQGRILLMKNRVEEAENALEQARKKGLDTPSLDIDLATLYYRKDQDAHEKDHEQPSLRLLRTINLLNGVLDRSNLSQQERAAAWFDLSVAYEKISANDMAAAARKKYLEIDPAGRPSASAQGSQPPAPAKVDFRNPDTLLALTRDKAQDNLQPGYAEQFQQRAIELWLPMAAQNKQSKYFLATQQLASILEQSHSDPWLRNFLAALPKKPDQSHAVQALSTAFLANEEGRHDEATQQAEIALRGFRESGNLPGELRARFEELYALRIKLQSSDCLERASKLREKLAGTAYTWLQAQTSVESAQCESFVGEPEESDHDTQEALGTAGRGKFPVLEMRILGISASLNHQLGKNSVSWNLAIQGLERYWNGSYPATRLDQFYAVMWQCARDKGYLRAAEVFLRHTIELREDRTAGMERNEIREGMLHLHLANILQAEHKDTQATIERNKASAKQEGIEKYAKEYRLTTLIEPAELALQQHDATRALSTLEPMGALLKTTEDNFIILSYYRLMGDIKLKQDNLDEASSAYQSAIKIADTSLEELASGPDRLDWLRITDASYRGLVRTLLRQGKQQEALTRWEWYKNLPVAQGETSNFADLRGPMPSAAQVQKPPASLPQMTGTRVVYAIFKDGLQIWLVRNSGIQGRWVEIRQSDLEQNIQDFMALLANRNSELKIVKGQSQSLYSVFIEPIASNLTQGELLVAEMDKAAYNLPLEALQDPAGRYVAERFPILYSPGIWIERSLLRYPTAIRPQASLLLVDASDLPAQKEVELKTIQEMFPRTSVADAQHTTWSSLRLRLATSEVIHYMGHGIAHGNGTELRYYGKQSIGPVNLTPDLFGHSRLVVLSACSTGRGEEDGVLDPDNLVHSLLAAGIPRVVTSHWNVDSESTALLMSNFYRHLAKDSDAVQAMYVARKDLLQAPATASPSYSHPYYWAGFSLTGRAP